mgnify:CR=1 FL=1
MLRTVLDQSWLITFDLFLIKKSVCFKLLFEEVYFDEGLFTSPGRPFDCQGLLLP